MASTLGIYHMIHTLYTRASRTADAFSYRVLGNLPWWGVGYRRRRLIASSESSLLVCNAKTDLCIEGYARSANSFFYVWFKLINPDANIAHHTHSIENIRLAFDYALPTVILIRKPLDAVVSHAIFEGSMTPSPYLMAWIKFYHWLYLQPSFAYTLVDFSEATLPTNETIERINTELGSSFLFSDQEAPEVHEKAKESLGRYVSENWEAKDQIKVRPLPVEGRKEIASILKEVLRDNPSMKEANDLYHSLISKSKNP